MFHHHQPLHEVSSNRRNRQLRGGFVKPTATPQRPVATDNSIADPPTAGKTVTVASYTPNRATMATPSKPLFGSETKANKYLLPPVNPELPPLLTVILDLDETLVSNRDPNLPAAILRPYCIQALEALRSMPRVEVCLWTASTDDTAMPVVAQLGATGFNFDAVICRSDAWFTDGVHSKDIRLLGRPMDKIVVFDNAPQCLKLNRGNAVLVDDFFGHSGPEDCTLFNLVATVAHLVRDIVVGKSVPEALHGCAVQGRQLGMVRYSLPEGFRGDLSAMSPLQMPVHGDFYKLHPQQF